MLFRFNPLNLYNFDLICILGLYAFGLIGFVFSILSVFLDKRKSKKNPYQSFVAYMGMILVFTGIVFRLMHWPFQLLFLLGGLVLIVISYFIKKEKPNSKNDLLDDQLMDEQ
ncbi:hypothetical protein CW751_00805 [Brumimicrobium salinarum]|uniref:Uncharacterized protein n=2 Tax=Brumimicrobium salinarum TaxID=2058658 RepID=A0A2I0R5Q4_9FLAO|nr:hypothetical protein CW751_00805 [Brumimicrobium salinarum]